MKTFLADYRQTVRFKVTGTVTKKVILREGSDGSFTMAIHGEDMLAVCDQEAVAGKPSMKKSAIQGR